MLFRFENSIIDSKSGTITPEALYWAKHSREVLTVFGIYEYNRLGDPDEVSSNRKVRYLENGTMKIVSKDSFELGDKHSDLMTTSIVKSDHIIRFTDIRKSELFSKQINVYGFFKEVNLVKTESDAFVASFDVDGLTGRLLLNRSLTGNTKVTLILTGDDVTVSVSDIVPSAFYTLEEGPMDLIFT